MPKPVNPNRQNTPIMIRKVDKAEFRKFAKSTSHPSRKKGTESDSELFKRMIDEIKLHWQPTSNIPTTTYTSS